MNKNTKQRLKSAHKATVASGGFQKPVYKKKVKPFPKGQEMTMAMQREIYFGKGAKGTN